MSNDPERFIKVTLYSASGLVKRELLNLPDPFAVLTVDGEQTNITAVIRKTLSPGWNEKFDVKVRQSSMIVIQIFDHRRFRRPDQGFLGVYNISAAEALDLALTQPGPITRDLTMSTDNLPVSGKIIFGFSLESQHQRLQKTTILERPIIPIIPTIPSIPSSTQNPALFQNTRPAQSILHSNFVPQTLHSSIYSANLRGPVNYLNSNTSLLSQATEINRTQPSTTSGAVPVRMLDGKSQNPLPMGWQRRINHQNRPYYVDHNIQTTTRHPPQGPPSIPHPTSASPWLPRITSITFPTPNATSLPATSTASSTGSYTDNPLPLGWEERRTSQGQPYFVNHHTRKTIWTDPRRTTQL